MTEYHNILVCVDGSKEAEYALQKSVEIAKRCNGSALTIVNVIDTTTIGEEDEAILRAEAARSHALLQRSKEYVKENDIGEVQTLLEKGSPHSLISESIAPRIGADLIICGATGLKDPEHFFLGSVSAAIVTSATCDVLVSRK